MLETPGGILVCQEEKHSRLCVFVCAHMQACVQKLHVLAMVPLHWMHSCLTECVDTLQPPPPHPPFHFSAPLSVAEAECCTTVLKLTSSGPLGGSEHPAPPAAEGKGRRPASISRPPSQKERAEINGTQLVIETSETCSAVNRALPLMFY